MSAQDWSAVPARDVGAAPDAVVLSDEQEARHDTQGSATGPSGDRVQGRPAPQYGEYAPDGWVNPVLAEQERAERAAAVAAPTGVPAPGAPAQRTPAAGRRPATAVVRLGASSGDLFLTLMLLGLGLWSVVGYFRVGDVATAVRRAIEQQYTTLAAPAALSSAAIVNLVGAVVILGLTVWWSVVRLRAGKRSAWVPLLGGVVATVFSTVVFMVVLAHDPQFASWWAQRTG
jgi:hypothetical protein